MNYHAMCLKVQHVGKVLYAEHAMLDLLKVGEFLETHISSNVDRSTQTHRLVLHTRYRRQCCKPTSINSIRLKFVTVQLVVSYVRVMMSTHTKKC